MRKPYICEGTIVRISKEREGQVICIDKTKAVAIIHSGCSFLTEKFENLQVVSYREVM